VGRRTSLPRRFMVATPPAIPGGSLSSVARFRFTGYLNVTAKLTGQQRTRTFPRYLIIVLQNKNNSTTMALSVTWLALYQPHISMELVWRRLLHTIWSVALARLLTRMWSAAALHLMRTLERTATPSRKVVQGRLFACYTSLVHHGTPIISAFCGDSLDRVGACFGPTSWKNVERRPYQALMRTLERTATPSRNLRSGHSAKSLHLVYL
jgi:hypothetical protein